MLLSIVVVTMYGCGSSGGGYIARRGTFTLSRWLRYEFGRAKSFSTGSAQIREDRQVIGYEPSWLIYDSLYQNYPFHFLSDLVVGEYDVNPYIGIARSDSGRDAVFNKQIILDAVYKNNDINILVALTRYGDYPRNRLVIEDNAGKRMIAYLDGMLEEISTTMGAGRDRVGVMVDFHNIPLGEEKEFADFIVRLKKGLYREDEEADALLYLVVTPEETPRLFQDSLQSEKILRNVNTFILRTHRFGEIDTTDQLGPMMPIGLDSASQKPGLDSLTRFCRDSLKIDFEKLVIEVPYYGLQWEADSSALHKPGPILPFNTILNQIQLEPIDHDTIRDGDLEGTLDGAFYNLDSITYRFEDTLSLDQKYKWVNEEDILGVSLYGLGYGQQIDNGVDEVMWRLLSDNFGETPPRLFFPAIAFLLCFFVVAIFWSVIRHWQTRFALKEKRGKFWYYVLLLFLLIVCIIICAISIEIIPPRWKIIILIFLIIIPFARFLMRYMGGFKR